MDLLLLDCRLCGRPTSGDICSACDLRKQADACWANAGKLRRNGDHRRARVYAVEAVRLHDLAQAEVDGVSL